MKKILPILLAAAMLVSAAAGCGKKGRDSAEEYSRKLASGELKPNAKISKNAKNGSSDETETNAPDTEGADTNSAAGKMEAEDSKLKEREAEITELLSDMPIGKLDEYIDKAETEYSSFDFVDISSDEFFIGKKLQLVAMVENHQMTFYDQMGIMAEVTNELLSISYADPENPDSAKQAVNVVYGVTSPITTPGGAKYVAVAFGDHELTKENSKYNTDCFALIRINKDAVSPEDPSRVIPAGEYIFLLETGFTEKYEIFKVVE